MVKFSQTILILFIVALISSAFTLTLLSNQGIVDWMINYIHA